VRSIVGDTLSLLVQNISTIIAGTVIAFSANWKLALLILALVPLMGLQSWVQVKFMQGFAANAKVRNIKLIDQGFLSSQFLLLV